MMQKENFHYIIIKHHKFNFSMFMYIELLEASSKFMFIILCAFNLISILKSRIYITKIIIKTRSNTHK